MRNQVRKAFTLVEILIVVVILGILAAIVVPQFTNATQDAQAGNIQAQLDTLNNQIELFKARTNEYPDFTAAEPWSKMITAVAGEPGTGGYIKAPPVNPVNQLSTVVVGAPNATGGNGWYWEVNANGVGTLYADEYDARLGHKRPTPGVGGQHD